MKTKNTATVTVLKDLSRFYNHGVPNMLYLTLGINGFPFLSGFSLYFGDSSADNAESGKFQAILWFIAGGTRGGPNRIRILHLLRERSLNAHQISRELNLDHKTVKHHLNVLVKNSLISKSEDVRYGAAYTLTTIMSKNTPVLEEIISKIRGS